MGIMGDVGDTWGDNGDCSETLVMMVGVADEEVVIALDTEVLRDLVVLMNKVFLLELERSNGGLL